MTPESTADLAVGRVLALQDFLTFTVLQMLRRHPIETFGQVKEGWQLELAREGELPLVPLKACTIHIRPTAQVLLMRLHLQGAKPVVTVRDFSARDSFDDAGTGRGGDHPCQREASCPEERVVLGGRALAPTGDGQHVEVQPLPD